MSDIDFQNGFICGMATRGLTVGLYSVGDKYLIAKKVSDYVSLIEHMAISEDAVDTFLFDWPETFIPIGYDSEPFDTVDLLTVLTPTDTVTVLLY